jgi:4-hydroxy 2-oxovalerate aldolase
MKSKQNPETNQQSTPAGRWVSYRPDIKVMDCTIRDGGLMNKHFFDDKIVKAVYNACVDGGIDYMEIGYKGSGKIFSRKDNGPWKFSTEEDIRKITEDNPTDLKISVMADAERTNYKTDILPRNESVIDMIRVAAYIHQVPIAMDMIKDAHDKGYETCFNLMALSTCQERDVDEALEIVCDSEVDGIYVVDSFGSMYGEQVAYMVRKFLHYARPSGKQIGLHAHNNQQLAYSNTIESIIAGANFLDASMAGLGRGAGNCQLENLIGFLHNPKFRLRPVLECIQKHILPLQKDLKWGPDIPYMITGLLNQHPRDAMKFNDSDDNGNYVKFFDSMIDEEV